MACPVDSAIALPVFWSQIIFSPLISLWSKKCVVSRVGQNAWFQMAISSIHQWWWIDDGRSKSNAKKIMYIIWKVICNGCMHTCIHSIHRLVQRPLPMEPVSSAVILIFLKVQSHVHGLTSNLQLLILTLSCGSQKIKQMDDLDTVIGHTIIYYAPSSWYQYTLFSFTKNSISYR